MTGQYATLVLLVEAGADPWIENPDGKMAVHFAKHNDKRNCEQVKLHAFPLKSNQFFD